MSTSLSAATSTGFKSCWVSSCTICTTPRWGDGEESEAKPWNEGGNRDKCAMPVKTNNEAQPTPRSGLLSWTDMNSMRRRFRVSGCLLDVPGSSPRSQTCKVQLPCQVGRSGRRQSAARSQSPEVGCTPVSCGLTRPKAKWELCRR